MPGHVFLMHGDLTQVACDAWLVPSAETPLPGAVWQHAVSPTIPPETPRLWSEVKGRVIPWEPLKPDWPRPWVTLTFNDINAPAGNFVEPAQQFLDVASCALPPRPRSRRALPLLALPVTGAGYAGGAARAGEIVRHLLPMLYSFVAGHDIDVVLVMKDPAQHAAAQAVRANLMGERGWPELHEAMLRKADGLATYALRGQLVLFLGAGISQAAGLPSWGGLINNLAGPELAADVDFQRLGPLDQARVIQARLPADKSLGLAVSELLRADHYSLVHGLLASLPVSEVVTTNYDTLFETASSAINRPVDVLPYEATAGGRWLLKLHGCVSKPNDIVLTREDYLRYDASRAALAGLVQGLLITRHMLFVGFSLADDNFHRIADAVRRAVQREPFGTSLSVAGNRLLREVWTKDLDWIEMGELPQSARLLEVFLDRVAAMATSTADHLFDHRYVATLAESERGLRDQLEHLANFIRQTPSEERCGAAWAEVQSLLARLGHPAWAESDERW